MKRALTLCSALLALLFVSPASAQTGANASGEFSLQGRLTTTGGQAVADGQQTLTINIYQQGNANAVYTQTSTVTTRNGFFSTMVGANGSGSANFQAMPNTQYELGITLAGQQELLPRLPIGSAVRSLTADVAANAEKIGGLSLSTNGQFTANSLFALDSMGHIPSGLLGGSTVSSINGQTGNVNIVGGNGLNVSTTGNTLSLSFTGNGSGNFNLPYTNSFNLGSGQTGLSLTNTAAGSVASFLNTGNGSALNLSSTSGSALNIASTTGSAITAASNSSNAATLDLTNNGGTALNLAGNSATNATLTLRNSASGSGATLINAMNTSGNAAFTVAANGTTTIHAAADTVGGTTTGALNVVNSVNGGAALSLTGGLRLSGPVGTATMLSGTSSLTVNNAYARSNSIILLTVSSAVDAVPVRVASQGNGTFTISLLNSALGNLTGNLAVNYLIINQ